LEPTKAKWKISHQEGFRLGYGTSSTIGKNKSTERKLNNTQVK
jgi:hypothetical protein